MKPIVKIVFVVLLFITTVFAVLVFTTNHFEITFPILFVNMDFMQSSQRLIQMVTESKAGQIIYHIS